MNPRKPLAEFMRLWLLKQLYNASRYALQLVGCIFLVLMVLSSVWIDSQHHRLDGAAARKKQIAYSSRHSCEVNPGNVSLHVVVSCADTFEHALPWIRALGWSHSIVYVYTRTQSDSSQHVHGLEQALLCQEQLVHRLLLPNHGKEAAVYLTHIVEHYDRLPAAILFTHCHGPFSWHTQIDPFLRRAKAFYRGLQPEQLQPWLTKFAAMPVTLSAGCQGPSEDASAECNNLMLCNQIMGPRHGPLHTMWGHGRLAKCRNNATGRRHSMRSYSRLSVTQAAQAVCKYGGTSPCDPGQPLQNESDFERQNARRSYEACEFVLAKYGIIHDWSPDRFWSCCSSFIVPGMRIQLRSRQFYQDLLNVVMNTSFTDRHTSRGCMEYPAYDIWNASFPSPQQLHYYTQADELLGAQGVDPWGL